MYKFVYIKATQRDSAIQKNGLQLHVSTTFSLILVRECLHPSHTFPFFFADIQKFGIGLESLHFPTFFRKKGMNVKFAQRDGHGKSTNSHGKVIEKYFAKSVGTLLHTFPIPSPHSPLTRTWQVGTTHCAHTYLVNRA